MLMPEMRAIYPCLCLWRGLEQITSTAPCRRMILHFSHIGLTDGRTFTETFRQDALKRGLRTRRGVRDATSQNSSQGVYAAVLARTSACQGVRTFGPSAVTATVNSKWAASEPS